MGTTTTTTRTTTTTTTTTKTTTTTATTTTTTTTTVATSFSYDVGNDDCWWNCAEKGGSCSFCGTGYCCSSKWIGEGNGDCPEGAVEHLQNTAAGNIWEDGTHVCINQNIIATTAV